MVFANKEEMSKLVKLENEYFSLKGFEAKETDRCILRSEIVTDFKKTSDMVNEAIEKLTLKISELKEQQENEKLQKVQREEQQKIENKRLGLCELTGTQKQVSWANELRKQLITKVEQIKEQSVLDKNLEILKTAFFHKGIEDCSIELIENALQFILKNKAEATYYIDTRYFKVFDTLVEAIKEMRVK